jgi:hypothetical protein
MMVSSRARLFARFAPAALVAVLAGLVSSGCEDKHIGRRCDLALAGGAAGASGAASGSTMASINSQAVECPSRICLQAANEVTAAAASPLCSAECSSDDDCDGQTGPGAGLCHTSFKCTIATTVGAFCCRKLCVCADYLPGGVLKPPPSCLPGAVTTCANVGK